MAKSNAKKLIAQTPSTTPQKDQKLELQKIIENQALHIEKLALKTDIMEEKLNEHASMITNLIERLKILEFNKELLESKLSIASHVSEALEIDNNNQYSWRNCLVIRGTPAQLNEVVGDVEDKVNNILINQLKLPEAAVDIDRSHRIGPIKNGSQAIVVKFKSFKQRTLAYKARKTLPNPIKISLSLTARRTKLLEEAQQLTEDKNKVHFCFSDINCNLKVRFKHKVAGKHIYSFNNIKELQQILMDSEDNMQAYNEAQNIYEDNFQSHHEYKNEFDQ